MKQKKGARKKFWQIAICAVIKHKSKFLIIQRSSEEKVLPLIWEFPSGKIKIKEFVVDGLAREVKEEIGIDITPYQPTLIGFSDYSSKTKRTIQLNFLVNLPNKPTVKLSKEHCQYAWVTSDDPRLDKFLKEILKPLE